MKQCDKFLSILSVQATDRLEKLVEQRTSQNVLERKFDVAGIKGRRLDKGQVVLACKSVSKRDPPVSNWVGFSY